MSNVKGKFKFIRDYVWYDSKGTRCDFSKGKIYTELSERLHYILTNDEFIPTVEGLSVSLKKKDLTQLEEMEKVHEKALQDIKKNIEKKSDKPKAKNAKK